MDCATYHELLAPDVDGALGRELGAEARAHVAACAQCAALRMAQVAARDLLRQPVPRYETPATVKQRIMVALDREAVQTSTAAHRRSTVRRRMVIVGAIAAALILMLIPRLRTPSPDLLAILAHDVQTANTPELAIRTDDIDAVRRYYRSAGRIDFDRTVMDLATKGFQPVGAAVVAIGAVTTTFTVYDGPLGKVVCRRFRAGAVPLPQGGERVGDAQVFTIDGVTVAIQRDGDVVCCLASTMPRDVFVRQLIAHHHS